MRIYVDSRYRTPESASASDFTVELLEALPMPQRCRIRLHDVSVPYAWRTVEYGLNQNLFVEERVNAGSSESTKRLIVLPVGQYDGRTLAQAIATGLNAGHSFGVGAPYTVAYSEQTGTISVTLSPSLAGSWTFWPDQDLAQQASWPGANPKNPRSFNRNLRVREKVFYTSLMPFVSDFVDLMTVKSLYVCSDSLGLQTNVGPAPGQRSCLCKVAVTSGYGYLIHSDGSSWEYVEGGGGQLLKRLSFRLEDVAGAVVPLHGCEWSFAISINDPVDFAS